MYNLQENSIQLEIFIQGIQSFIYNNMAGQFDHPGEFSTLKENIISMMSQWTTEMYQT